MKEGLATEFCPPGGTWCGLACKLLTARVVCWLQGLLSTSQASALQAQQDYVHDITGTAAAALTNSIQAALQEEHQKHQEQVRLAGLRLSS